MKENKPLVEKFYEICDMYYNGSQYFVEVEEALKEHELWHHIDKENLRVAYAAGFDKAAALCDHSLGDMVDTGFEEWYEREVANPPETWDSHHD